MGNLQYGDYDDETAQRDKQAYDESNESEFLTLEEGTHRLRILPPPAGKREVFYTVWQHFIELPGKKRSVVCARLQAKKPCRICQKVDELKASKSRTDQEMGSAMFARRRIFCNVVLRGKDGHEDSGPNVWAFGKQVYEQLLTLRNNQDVGGNYCNPTDAGFDVVVTRVGKGKNDTKYTVNPARKPTPLSDDDDIAQAFIDGQKGLEIYGQLPESELIDELLAGGEEYTEVPPNRRMQAPAKAAPATNKQRAATPPPRRRTAEDDAIETEGYAVEEDEDA